MDVETTFADLLAIVSKLDSIIARCSGQEQAIAIPDVQTLCEDCRQLASRLEDQRAHPVLFKCHVIVSDVLVRLECTAQLKSAVAGKTISRIWSEEDMTILHRRLETIRIEIDAQGKTTAHSLSGSSSTPSTSLDVDDPTSKPHNASASGQFDTYDTQSERFNMLRDFLLDSLAFTAMTDREEQVTEAYSETFDWIFRDDAHAFGAWLKGTDDTLGSVYWITGLPGSGKSTLMRYIGAHEKTTALLREWSGARPVTRASFYFWESGTAVQRSQAGLLRSLLHQLLAQQPGLIPVVFAETWAQIWAADARTRIRLTGAWPLAQLSAAFRRFFEVNRERSVYLLVDGLDEFEGDHQTMIALLEHAHRQPHTKVCVSSRPWGVFERAFHDVPTLRLQDLTAGDMTRFVHGKLNEAQQLRRLMAADPKATEELVASVVERADGVFLWVSLAVRTVLNTSTPSDDLADVRRRLESLPRSLNDLFHYLLFEANSSSANDISRIFQLIRAREIVCDFTRRDDDVVLNVWEMALTADTLKDAGLTAPIQKVPDDERTRLALQTIANISESCVGLVEIHPTRVEKRISAQLRKRPHNPFLPLRKIMYLHRTVKDYLKDDDVWQGVISHCPDFDPHLCHARASVLRFKLSLETPKRERTINEWWPRIVLAMTHARLSSPRSQQELFDYLNTLDDTLNWYWPPRGGSVADDSWARSCFGTFEERGRKPYPDPFLSLATKFGVVGYLDTYLDTYEYAYEHEKPLLSYAVEYLIHRQSSVYPLSDPRMVDVLFKNGEDPNLFREAEKDVAEDEDEDEDAEDREARRAKKAKKPPPKPKTPWVLALQAVQQADRRRWIEPYDIDPEGTARWAQILRKFLENGADPKVSVQATYKDKLETALEVIARIFEEYHAKEVQLVRDLILTKLKSTK